MGAQQPERSATTAKSSDDRPQALGVGSEHTDQRADDPPNAPVAAAADESQKNDSSRPKTEEVIGAEAKLGERKDVQDHDASEPDPGTQLHKQVSIAGALAVFKPFLLLL